jgi:hypothetical protein
MGNSAYLWTVTAERRRTDGTAATTSEPIRMSPDGTVSCPASMRRVILPLGPARQQYGRPGIFRLTDVTATVLRNHHQFDGPLVFI